MSDIINNQIEFSGIRSKLYKEALTQFPKSRKSDFEIMKNFLDPQKNEIILEVGAGSRFFSCYLFSCKNNLFRYIFSIKFIY